MQDTTQLTLEGQQLAFFRALAESSSELAGWYLGACIALATPANPESLVQAAHSIRELMNNLHTIAPVPVEVATGRLGDKFADMKSTWQRAKENTTCFSEANGWGGEIDDHARHGFQAVDEAIAWNETNRRRWKELHLETIRGLDVSNQQVPAWIEEGFVDQWDQIRTYFVRVAHRASTSRDEFSGVLATLERFVLDRLKPRTYSEQATLDALIREAEGRG